MSERLLGTQKKVLKNLKKYNMKKGIVFLLLTTLFSCTSKEIKIEKIPFFQENNNAQPSLVSKNGSLSLSYFCRKNMTQTQPNDAT